VPERGTLVEKIRAYLQQDIIPQYRRPIFERLSTVKEVEFTIIAGFDVAAPVLKLLDERRAEIRLKRVKTKTIRLGFLGDFSYQPQTISFALRHRPDVIIAGGDPHWLTAWGLLILGRCLRIPVLLWTHGLLKEETGPKWWIRKLFYTLADGLLLYGEHAKRLLVGKGFDPETLYIVFNSLDYDAQRKIADELTEQEILDFRQKLGVRQGEGLVGFVGRLQPVKRLDILVHAVSALSLQGKGVHVALVGEGPEQEKLASLAESLGIKESVHFLGPSYDEHFIGLVLSASDLSVIPSGAGLSVMHALAFGTPVLLHDHSGANFPEWEAVEEEVTGFIYRFGDVDDLTEKLSQAIFPYPLKPRMAEQCISVTRDRYNPDRQAAEFLAAITKTLARRGEGNVS
jgi:glycosyltransferase involved in cell wall biosynthesis